MQCLFTIFEYSFPHLFSKLSRFEWYIIVSLPVQHLSPSLDSAAPSCPHSLPSSHMGCLVASYTCQAHSCPRIFAFAVLLASVSLLVLTCMAPPHLLQVLLAATSHLDNPQPLYCFIFLLNLNHFLTQELANYSTVLSIKVLLSYTHSWCIFSVADIMLRQKVE